MGFNHRQGDLLTRDSPQAALTLGSMGLRGADRERLREARVLLVGTGGLGSPAALFLAEAGVGAIGLCDMDQVDVSNLQRQVIHFTPDIGRPKVESARDKILAVNPGAKVNLHRERLTSANALDIFRPYDIILDGTDNFATRYLCNDACVLLGKPLVHGSIFRFDGQATVFLPGEGPCYRCLYPEPPPPGSVPSCAEAGVIGVLPGVIGGIMALEAVKLITGVGRTLAGRLLLYSSLEMEFTTINLRRDPRCPLCSDEPEIRQLIDYEVFCGLKPTE